MSNAVSFHSNLNPTVLRRPRTDRPRPSLWFAPVTFIAALTFSNASPAADLDYHTDVTPILRDYCAGCHNNEDLEGELSVETFAQLMKGGEHGKPILPGNSSESLLFQMLTGAEKKKKMPPKREPQPSPEQVALLQAWIDQGAKGPSEERDQSLLATLLVPTIQPPTNLVQAATASEYSPNGKYLAIARYAKVELLDSATLKAIRVLPDHPGKVNAVHFSSDGSRLVTASGITGLRGEATLWDVETGEKIKTFTSQHRDLLYDAELSPDGTLLATAGYDREILLRDATNGEVVRRIDGHNGAVFDLAFNPDGTILASASADETVKLWKVSDGQRLDTLNQPQAEQYSVLFTPDGNSVIAAGADNRIRLWQLISRESPAINPLLHARFAHEEDIVTLALSRDGRWLVSSAADRTLKLWSLPDLAQTHIWDQQPDLAVAVTFQPEGTAFTAAFMNGSLRTWPLEPQLHNNTTPDRATATLPTLPSPEPEPHKLSETEPNQNPSQAQAIELPAEISGTIDREGDADLFRFTARAGQEWVLEVNAARSKSALDSKIEVLDADGHPIEQIVLQALRDSWFTFRGKDSDTSSDFRVQNWREMELNEYLYANGEVVKLWLYPNGPDSGFKVYPGFGNRHTYFGTTALSHPLGEPCYIVQPLPPGSHPSPNGLPLFRLNYENDDEPHRRWGTDSQLFFTAPQSAPYLARISDVREYGGTNYSYLLTIRPRHPDFKISIEGNNPSVSPGSGREFTLKAERLDGFEGEIRVDINGLPDGFAASTPIVIEPGHSMALGVIYALPNAKAPEGGQAKASRLTATATIQGKRVTHEADTLGEIKLGPPAKLLVQIEPDTAPDATAPPRDGPLEFTIAPGETITARVKATRVDFGNRIELGTDGAGRNLPHGVYVDNIGLNGLLIVEGQTERQFFVTAANWVPESTRYFHLRASADGGQASYPAILHVKKR